MKILQIMACEHDAAHYGKLYAAVTNAGSDEARKEALAVVRAYEDEKLANLTEAAKTKFLEHSRGIRLDGNKWTASQPSEDHETQWGQMIKPSKVSMSSLKFILTKFGRDLHNFVQDAVIGTIPVYDRFKTELGKVVTLTTSDAYLFVRAAIIEQEKTVEYKDKVLALEAAKKVVDDNKTKAERVAEAKLLISELENELN